MAAVTPLYRCIRFLSRGFTRVYFRLRVHGADRVPRRGGLIVVANHTSHLDPMVLGCASPRGLRFLARSTLFANPVMGRFYRGVGAIALARGEGDRGALATAINLLQEGNALAIFPEGTRSATGELQPLKPGVGLLAEHAKAPIIAAHISGTFEAMPRHSWFAKPARITVRWSEPRAPEEWRALAAPGLKPSRAITAALSEEMKRLAGQAKGSH